MCRSRYEPAAVTSLRHRDAGISKSSGSSGRIIRRERELSDDSIKG